MNDLNEFMATEVMGYFFNKESESAQEIWVVCRNEKGYVEKYIVGEAWNPVEDIAQSIMCRDKFLMDNPTYQFSLYSYRNLENEIINHVYLEDGHGNIYESLLSKLSLGVCSAIKQAVENG